MNEPVLYCKSFAGDLARAVRLCGSIARFNREALSCCLSAPRQDLAAFGEALAGLPVTLVADEDIFDAAVAAWGAAAGDDLARLPAHLRQQAIKCEFWRWADCATYLVVDSDSYFIRPFGRADLMYDGDTPYTVMHEAKEVLQFAARAGLPKVARDYHVLRQRFRRVFGRRAGRDWDFGPTPVVWSARVWQLLQRDWAMSRGTNIFALIREYPCELQLYGEYLLHARPFPLMAVEPLFKVYHYRQQYEEGLRLGEDDAVLTQNFLGIVRQSNWDRPAPPSRWRPRRGFGWLARRRGRP